ncbi:family 20 glycosylhydrolase [Hymenobacter sp. ISL-91]|uniref:beta-N-acetylhexosaminidase n=1 Tax=Hymenobacter sp. ISL-91 TaxID=2819151 RepID=UPI001BEAF6D9|nr:family 20 glycosylhydrolase [Hymenobacter sp. ISL-91]MBT2558607.1 family 20 glycosylhydrolase [Hymenobacter sp. ISL-91]
MSENLARVKEPPALLPQPRAVAFGGPGFTLTSRTRLYLTGPTADSSARAVGQELAIWLHQRGLATGRLHSSADTTLAGVHLTIDATPVPDSLREQYTLWVGPAGIHLRASTATGLHNGVQTLRQLLPAALAIGASGPVAVPGVQIEDRPAYAWRGLLLDVSRHFLPQPQLLRYLDVLAAYKLNRLHLHLTDDQGWRLPAPARWPRLNTVGAWRTDSTGQRYGGFYTAAKVRELVAQARKCHIELVPEIDMPGHVRAALAAYPELSCTGRPGPVATDWGVHEDVLCVGNPRTYEFAADVLGEVMDLFPGKFVHVGGDETPTVRWRECPRCQALMRRENLHSEHELQTYFLRQVAGLLAARGRRPIVWDEALGLQGQEGSRLPAGTVVQAWHGLTPAAAAVRAGHSAISSPSSFTYFDKNTVIIDLPQAYQFNPTPAGPTAAERSRVLGGEAALWTERLRTPAQMEQALFPRLLALAEVLWRGPQPVTTYPAFRARARQHYPWLAVQGVQVGFETRPLSVTTTPAPGGLQAALAAGGPDIELHYTLDGTPPTLTSPLYSEPLLIARPTRLRVLAARAGRPLAELPAVRLRPHAALGRPVQLAAPFHPAYSGGGPNALTDGRLGSADYRDGAWQGFERTDFGATLALGEAGRGVDSVTVAFLQDWNSWVFLPRTVRFRFSADGRTFGPAIEQQTTEPLTLVGPVRRTYRAAVPTAGARFVRVEAANVGVCPPGHPGAGGAAFLMVDEVIVTGSR